MQKGPGKKMRSYANANTVDNGGSSAVANNVSKSKNISGIPASFQAKMENTFNTDFSGVSVHANSQRATDVGALAYTQGSEIHVAPGQFSTGTTSGKRLLAHEFAHADQQMKGQVNSHIPQGKQHTRPEHFRLPPW